MSDPRTALTDIIQQAEATISTAQSGLDYVAPPSPPPPLNIADYLIPKAGRFVRETFVRLLADGRTAVYLPRNTGVHYPMDVKIIGDGLFDRVTDYPGHWTDPTAYRIYTNSNPGSNSLGIKLAPLTYDPTQGRIKVSSYLSPLSIITNSVVNGVVVDTRNAQGEVYFELRLGIDFGGDLKVQDPLVSMYFYNYSTPLSKQLKKPQTLEEFSWIKGSSWAQWAESDLQPDASYKQTKIITYNKFIPDTLSLPVLPAILL